MADKFAVFLVICVGAFVGETVSNEHECPNPDTWLATLHKVTISGPFEQGRRHLIKGKDTLLTMEFTPKNDISEDKIKANVNGIFGTLAIPYDIKEKDACKNCNLTCPLKANEPVVYNSALHVEKWYPPASLSVTWRLETPKGELIVCFVERVKIVRDANHED